MFQMNAADKRELYEAVLDSEVDALTVKLKGNSMEPALRHGDIVFLKKGFYFPGDMIGFLSGTEIVIHRMIGWWFTRSGCRVLTKGDNRRGFDRPVSRTEILGRVMSWNHNGDKCVESRIRKIFRMWKSLGGNLAARI